MNTKTTSKTEQIKNLIREARSSIVSVKFQKKDGSERVMTFNARHREGIKGIDATPSAQQAVATRAANNPNLINVIDLNVKRKTRDAVKSWRSFDCERVVSVKSGGKTVEFGEV